MGLEAYAGWGEGGEEEGAVDKWGEGGEEEGGSGRVGLEENLSLSFTSGLVS